MKAERDAKCAVAMFLSYLSPCSFKKFINVFAVRYVKANSKEI